MSLKTVFKLVRLPNLLLMGLTMVCFRFFVVIPILNFSGSTSSITHFNYLLVVLSVLLIAAGGYVINDYYDVEIDRINKPEKMIVGKDISEEKAFYLFHLLSFAGILIAFYLSFFAGINFIGIIHLCCAFILWVYASTLKRILLAGNIIISLLCSFTLFITVFYDPTARKAEPILMLLGGYSVFAFLLSMIREMIKDIEDLDGDLACGCRTLPVVAGIKISKTLIGVLIISTILMLGYIQLLQQESNDFRSLIYVGLLIQIPLILLFYRLIKSHDNESFHFCSSLTKLIMFTGIVSMPVFYLGFK